VPREQLGEVYRLADGSWGVRWRDNAGKRHRKSGFRTKSEARAYFMDVIRPALKGLTADAPDRTFAEHVEDFLKAKAATIEPTSVRTLRIRLAYAEKQFGTLTLRELERRPREIAEWAAGLNGMRYPCVSALRQALDVACKWHLITTNPAKAMSNPAPKPREIEPFSLAEIDMIAAELGPADGAIVVVASEAALRPEEWIALERRDVRADAIVVERVFADKVVRPYGKTVRSRRRVPLTDRASAALGALPARIDTRILFPNPQGGHIDLHNWRNRWWYPALEAAGLAKRGPYALRHSGISHMLAAGIPTFNVARYAGTSLEMIERTYGHLTTGSEEHARALMAAYADRLARDWPTDDAADAAP
jgi:integrase